MPNVMVALPNIGGALCSTPEKPVNMHRFALNIAQKCLAAGLCPDPVGAYSVPQSPEVD